jgi:hypothetical protein
MLREGRGVDPAALFVWSRERFAAKVRRSAELREEDVDRRKLISGAAALSVLSVAAVARADEKTAKLSDFFPYLDKYWMLPPGQRSHFALAYYAYRDRKPAPDLKAFILEPNGTRRPIGIDRTGRILMLPGLTELHGPEQGGIDFQAGQKVGVGLQVEARVPLGPSIDVHEVQLALAQAQAAINANAGVLAFAVPKLTRAYMIDAGPGRAVFPDGHAVPLPIEPKSYFAGQAYFDAESMAGAKTIMLGRAPSRISLGGKPRG